MLSRSLCAIVLLAVIATPAVAADPAAPVQLAIGTGYHFSVGDYGESRDTQIHYVPLIARGEVERWSAEITLPLIALRGPSGIAGVVSGADSDRVSTDQGLGDVQIASSYLHPPVRSGWPYFEAEVRLKLPTAAGGDNLGTGELDVVPSLEATWSIGRWNPFLGLAYEILGDPGESVAADGSVTGFELDNAWRASAGTSYQASARLGVGMLFEYGTPTSADAGDRLDAIPYTSVQIDPAWTLQIYASAGLASGSADVGSGIQITRAWSFARATPVQP